MPVGMGREGQVKDVEALCANCGEVVLLSPAGTWRHEYRYFLECPLGAVPFSDAPGELRAIPDLQVMI